MDLHAVCCTLLLLTCAGLCFGQEVLLPERINKAVGENVVITPVRIPDPPHALIRWRFNGNNILSAHPTGITSEPSYTDRISLDNTTLALELRNLTESDIGQYSLTVNTSTDSFTAVTSLQVLVPASNVTIVSSETELVEFSTVSLICSVSGSSVSLIWLNGSSVVTAGERVQLTDSNRNLTITSVFRGDTGPYQCKASNIVSNTTGPPLTLTIYYGPEKVIVKADPEGPFYSSGSKLTLTCSAESIPAAELQWAVNGTELGEMGQELRLSNIQISQSGSYTCIAHNRQTLRYSTSEPISITVLVPASNVTIVTNKTMVLEHSTVSLICSASGSSLSFVWLQGRYEVTAGGRFQLTDENKNLTITSIHRGDGSFTCEASNIISKAKSTPLRLSIFWRIDGKLPFVKITPDILFGVSFGAFAAAGLIYYYMKIKEKARTNPRGNNQNGATDGARDLIQDSGVTIDGSDTMMHHKPHPEGAMTNMTFDCANDIHMADFRHDGMSRTHSSGCER